MVGEELFYRFLTAEFGLYIHGTYPVSGVAQKPGFFKKPGFSRFLISEGVKETKPRQLPELTVCQRGLLRLRPVTPSSRTRVKPCLETYSAPSHSRIFSFSRRMTRPRAA